MLKMHTVNVDSDYLKLLYSSHSFAVIMHIFYHSSCNNNLFFHVE